VGTTNHEISFSVLAKNLKKRDGSIASKKKTTNNYFYSSCRIYNQTANK